jgi:hypothetical protein
MMVAYFLGDLFVALAMAVKSEKAIEIVPSLLMIQFEAFFGGLTFLTAIRQNHQPCLPSAPRTSRRKLLSCGWKQFKMLRKFSKHCPKNYEHHVLLLLLEPSLLLRVARWNKPCPCMPSLKNWLVGKVLWTFKHLHVSVPG